MATLRSPAKKKRVSEYEATPVPLRLRKTQRSFLNEKKRKSPLYSEQKYLRKLIDLGIKAVERDDEYDDDKKGVFNPKSATSIAELKNEITKEVIEHIRASTKHLEDVTGIQFDGLSKNLAKTRDVLTSQNEHVSDQLEDGHEQDQLMAKILVAMVGQAGRAANLVYEMLKVNPAMSAVIAKGEQQTQALIDRYAKLLPTDQK